MFVITVIPIKKGITLEALSYLSSQSYTPGSIIEIPIRKEKEKGLVLSSEKAETQKAEIKSLPFELRRIEQNSEKRLIRPSLINALRALSLHFAVSHGALLAQAVRKEIFEEELFLTAQKDIAGQAYEAYVIQNRSGERFDIYKSIIRENFAKKQSVFFAAPTEELARAAFESLRRGIEDYSILESFKSKKKLKESLSLISTTDHPLLIVSTTDALPIIPSNTGTIILDEENSRFWRKRARPFLDSRALLFQFAREAKINIFAGALILRTETHQKVIDDEISEYGHMAGRIQHPVKTLVVDLKKTEASVMPEKKTFKVFSDELREMISYAHKKKKKMFVFSARRGLSPQTICLDCGNTVGCTRCAAPVVLHKKTLESKTVYTFICHHCGVKRDAMEKCINCDSWRLEPFGIGTHKIAAEIERITKETPVILDNDSAKTSIQAAKIAESFIKKGGILVGTEMAFDYLPEESVEYAAIASFDSLFSIPDFRANEHILRVLLETKLLASENILVQGRNVTNPIIETGLNGDINKCIKEELAARKSFNYPPFRTFIKISIKNSKEAVLKDVEIISNLLSKWNPTVFPAFIKTENGKTIAHILLSLPNLKWPDEELRNILMSFPPYIEIKVDPESLL